MIRVVLDTNVIVSALFSPAGFEDRVLKLGLHDYVQLYISQPVLAEYERVLSRPKFDFSKTRVRSTLQQIQNVAQTCTRCALWSNPGTKKTTDSWSAPTRPVPTTSLPATSVISLTTGSRPVFSMPANF